MRNKEEVVTEEAEIERSKKKGGGADLEFLQLHCRLRLGVRCSEGFPA